MSYPTSPVEDLHQVVPIPVDLDAIDNEPLSPGPELWPPKSTTRSVLHGLGVVQKYSAYGFCTFLGLHVASTVIVPILPMVPHEIKQEVFEMARSIYQQVPLFESVMIIGAAAVHVASGIGIRICRNILKKHKKDTNELRSNFTKALEEPVIKDDTRDDIGLGGITGILGLGYRKSWISRQLPGMSPLSFSGYILIPLVALHFTKFRYLPIAVGEDSSLVNLDYITYYLNHSKVYLGNALNFGALLLLLWVMMYHSVSGMLRINRKFSMKWKQFGYVVINGVTLMGLATMVVFKRAPVDSTGYIGRSFLKYLNHFWF
ncbi:uncharacterized protein CANTADRAFT_26774 [Suhomyces tanzawaensis NRRL Y-17324]|uniref:Mitochondrial adapter protein MCP1 transmembrane domain-containing protein n=1 Tax=Suhomyces tanzawaensis NRRL Y-17324 TaxID=984487 RepID=A0A1E4SHF6_9ASCO|nr:uncharacterized protein CANTADRAFT_26774 [Suhomyces tanzawaensis NRRL Y-17324]ODV78852.1 hypothetical protein CANTADRAFT_26774 [Suhomyces tanzawaensis NRRL Y-17324]